MQANPCIHLTVNTISGNSGIYIGNQNISTGISSHSKTNSAVGSLGTGVRFYRNLSIVYDPDVIDTPIDDRDVHVFAPQYNHTAPNILNTRVDKMDLETITQNAGVFIGETSVTGFDTHQKVNFGVGPAFGSTNEYLRNVNIIQDQDTLDSLIDDRDVKSGVFISSSNPPQIMGR